jgi:hypothetical protein
MNVSPRAGAVMAREMATLKELQEWYSYPDMLDMLEVIHVSNYNSWAAGENARRTAKGRGGDKWGR